MTIFGWVNNYTTALWPNGILRWINPRAFEARVDILHELRSLELVK